MPAKYWIKLYIDMLESARIAQLPDSLYRRLTELFLLAGRHNADGALPPVQEMAWSLHLSTETLLEDLRSLSETGELQETQPGQWLVTHFAERQAVSPTAQRMRQFRQRYAAVTENEPARNAGVTEEERQRNAVEADSTSVSDSDSESASGSDPAGQAEYPDSPAQAMQHPDVQVFASVTGGRIPGLAQYWAVIETVRCLRERHCLQDPALVGWLKPYWLAWSTRKRLDGRPYDPSSLTWLTEWALNNSIPPVAAARPDGPPGRGVPSPDETRRMLDERDQKNRSAVPPPEQLRAKIRGLQERMEGNDEHEVEKLAEKRPRQRGAHPADRGPGPPA